ncbi:DoxX family protein [Mangrovibrevibacter kandeliae]|uniref:DoxX family protein n=1 Tax=Mangrovibrevibacter kandeliae TaxID=2968473 RepID=UPI00389A26B2
MQIVSPPPGRRRSLTRRVATVTLALAYLAAGIIHLGWPDVFLPIMPGWVPLPRETILVTGACEIAGAIGLMLPRIRRLAGIMLALYAVCVFPANVTHAMNDLSTGTGLGWWYHGPRLLAQPLIVWWALYAGGIVDGFGRRGGAIKPPA